MEKNKIDKEIKKTKDKVSKKIKKDSNDVKTTVSFNLLEVIIIILITGIIVSVISSIIVYNNYDKLNTPNYRDMSKFEENYNKILNNYVEKIDEDELMEAAIKGMYNYLGDDYSMYLEKDDTSSLEEQLKGEYTGIGIEITYLTNENKESYIVITRVFSNSPAEEAGLKVGDILLELDNESLKDKDVSFVANTIKYGESDTHKLKVKREDKEIEATISRKVVQINSVSSKEVEKGIGYLKIDTFAANTGDLVKNELDKLDNSVKSLIIDLRDNTGGYLTSADEISNIFIEKGKNIYQIKDRNSKVTIYKAKKDIYRKFDKITVLINGNSASAAEILTLALKESAGAKVVGSKSFGKGSVQETEILESGAMVKYTTAYWLSPNGNSINKVGITPDIVVEKEEEQLNAAIKTLK